MSFDGSAFGSVTVPNGFSPQSAPSEYDIGLPWILATGQQTFEVYVDDILTDEQKVTIPPGTALAFVEPTSGAVSNDAWSVQTGGLETK
jgi:hypothetical protein